MEVGGQLHASVALLPGKQPHVPIGQVTGWAPEPVWTLWSKDKSLAPVGNGTPAVPPVARRYADWTISAPSLISLVISFLKDF
jgi:hypothetical protein